MIRLHALLLIATVIGASAPVTAQDTPSSLVSLAGVDLTAAASRAELKQRIDAAVEQVCPISGHRDPYDEFEWHHCRLEAEIDARAQMASAIHRAVRLANKADHTRVAVR
jgi:UrcA family protein